MFLNTNSVTYAVQNSNSEIIGDDGDLLGIFYEGELRGITDVYPVPFGPYQGNNFFLLYMYSNDTGTEEFNLKFYDESSGLMEIFSFLLPFYYTTSLSYGSLYFVFTLLRGNP